ncbi:hypothetical protein [Desulfovibrio litoralis]|uniref:hypothetical protein n=1 Tax=Desulfovibrio litoralis TaxID=466107 RepID=UPI0011609E12|nr:hypothetical protein [Desulfovibrio litoralis]
MSGKISGLCSSLFLACLFCFLFVLSWLLSPFLEIAGFNLPFNNHMPVVAAQDFSVKTAYGKEWSVMLADTKGAYLGISGGTAPLSLMYSPEGDVIALPGNNGHDFIALFSNRTEYAKYVPYSDGRFNSFDLHVPVVQYSVGEAKADWIPFGFEQNSFDNLLTTETVPTFGGGDLKDSGYLDNKEARQDVVPNIQLMINDSNTPSDYKHDSDDESKMELLNSQV